MRITFDNALNHIQFLATIFGRDRVRHVIVVLLLELNVPTDFDGFDYLVRGITIYNRDPSQMFGKGLYPAIAETYAKKVEVPQVESEYEKVVELLAKAQMALDLANNSQVLEIEL